VDAAVKIRGLDVEVCDCERCIENESYSEKFWNTISELEFRIDAYRAQLSGGDAVDPARGPTAHSAST
jgi:hypothetical protein